MDEVLDDFMPLTMTGIPLKSRNNISLSQIPSVSRLSRSYAKIKNKNVRVCQSTTVDNNCADGAIESMVTAVDTSQQKDSNCYAHVNGLQFCPMCQAPFDIIKIYPHIHVNQCNVNFRELKGKYI
jgi:hypothetical protein